jgi:hypothetical protein
MELYLHYPICIPVAHKDNFNLLLRKQVKDVKYLACEIFYENEKKIFNKPCKICSNTGNFKQHFTPSLVKKPSRVKVYNALPLPHSSIW